MVVGEYRISAVVSENAALPVFRVIDKFSFPVIPRGPEHLDQIPLKLHHIKGFQGGTHFIVAEIARKQEPVWEASGGNLRPEAARSYKQLTSVKRLAYSFCGSRELLALCPEKPRTREPSHESPYTRHRGSVIWLNHRWS
jgi:hypothetical protein